MGREDKLLTYEGIVLSSILNSLQMRLLKVIKFHFQWILSSNENIYKATFSHKLYFHKDILHLQRREVSG